jgi:hypothetical protein
MVDDLTTGRDALHRLDSLTAGAREEFDAAARGAEAHARRRADLARLKAEGYRELAAMRLDVIKAEATDSLSAAEKEAARLLTEHEAFTARIDGEVAEAEAKLKNAEALRRAGEVEVDAALNAYETLVTETEAAVQTDPGYIALNDAFEQARAVRCGPSRSWNLRRRIGTRSASHMRRIRCSHISGSGNSARPNTTRAGCRARWMAGSRDCADMTRPT